MNALELKRILESVGDDAKLAGIEVQLTLEIEGEGDDSQTVTGEVFAAFPETDDEDGTVTFVIEASADEEEEEEEEEVPGATG